MRTWQQIHDALFSSRVDLNFEERSMEALLTSLNETFYLLKRLESFFSEEQLERATLCLLRMLFFALEKAETNGLQRVEVRNLLSEAWRVHGLSSFGHHLQTWPYGFPGDFHAINMVVDSIETSVSGTLENMIGQIALASPITQQHREKLGAQAKAVEEMCLKFPRPKILSLACGASRDLESIQGVLAESGAMITLVDFDKDALNESAQRLRSIKDQVLTVRVDVRRLFGRLKEMAKENGHFHLAYAGGLFDYFKKPLVERTLKCLSSTIHDGGAVLFTNIAKGNPYRPWIETMGDWFLIERSEEDMGELLNVTGFQEKDLQKDATGLTWIARAYKTF